MNWFFSVLFPVLVHLLISEGVAVLAGNVLDSAACTALSAAMTLPFGICMYRQDGVLHRTAFHGAGDTHGLRKDVRTAAGDGAVRLHPGSRVVRVGTGGRIVRLGAGGSLCFALLCLAGGGVLNICWSGLLNLLRIASFFSNETQNALFASSFFMQLIGPGLMVPIAEELIFRGLVYARMRTKLQTGEAVFFSALLFALYHGNALQMIYAFPMAIVLALIYESEEKLAYPILFHMGANLAAILLP